MACEGKACNGACGMYNCEGAPRKPDLKIEFCEACSDSHCDPSAAENAVLRERVKNLEKALGPDSRPYWDALWKNVSDLEARLAEKAKESSEMYAQWKERSESYARRADILQKSALTLVRQRDAALKAQKAAEDLARAGAQGDARPYAELLDAAEKQVKAFVDANCVDTVTWMKRAEAAETQAAAMRSALDGIRIYGRDTLSGPAEGVASVAWVNEGVLEMVNRADKALASDAGKDFAGRIAERMRAAVLLACDEVMPLIEGKTERDVGAISAICHLRKAIEAIRLEQK